MDAKRTAERVARLSYGKLLSFLASWSRDVAAAEDALAEAFASALERWPVDGIPANPEAWLTTVAKRKLIDLSRRQTTERNFEGDVVLVLEDRLYRSASGSDIAFKDERLKLLFACSHPALDEHTRTPLMLQVVLGIDAARIASCFVVSPASMSKRLVRAKTKIKTAGIPFEVPDAHELPLRLAAVLEAIYAAYTSGWDNLFNDDGDGSGLTDEAIWLARLMVELLPDDPECKGVLALMLYCESRRNARRTETGNFVPLDEQDVKNWDLTLLSEAESILLAAAAKGELGRFQLEAAIQSAHALRCRAKFNNWTHISHLYEGLVRLFPTLGSLVGRCAAVMEAYGAARALELMQEMDAEAITSYQPYWALLGEIHQRLGNRSKANKAFRQAAGLAVDDATRRFLMEKAEAALTFSSAPASHPSSPAPDENSPSNDSKH